MTEVILIQASAIVLNILHAWHDAIRIRNSLFINHAKNGLVYGVFTVTCVCFSSLVWLAPALLFLRCLVFDQALNKMRGRGFTYQPQNPDSIVDRMENRLFGHKRAWVLSNLIYLVAWAYSNYQLSKPQYEVLATIKDVVHPV